MTKMGSLTATSTALLLSVACGRQEPSGSLSSDANDPHLASARYPATLQVETVALRPDHGKPAHVTSTYGVLDGTEDEVIGLVEDVAIGPDNLIFVLDSRFNVVRVINEKGTLRAVVGGPGRGPGEFLLPQGIEVDSDGTLFVADEDFAVHVFRRTGLEEWAYEHSIRLDYVPFDVCLCGNELIVHAFSPTRPEVLYRYSIEGDFLGALGEISSSSLSVLRLAYSEGWIACDQHRVFWGSRNKPEIHAFDPAGETLWVSEFTDLPSIDITVLSESGVRRTVPESGVYHQLIGLSHSPEGLWASYRTMTKEGSERSQPSGSYTSVLLDPESGQGRLARNDTLAVVAGSLHLQVTASNLPFPHLVTSGKGD